MITLMFFYLTGATIIYGVEVNAALNLHRLRSAPATEAGPAKPASGGRHGQAG